MSDNPAGLCGSEPPRPGSLCAVEGSVCMYDKFCCMECDSADSNCDHAATTAVCTDSHWVVMHRGEWCPLCVPKAPPAQASGTCQGFCGGPGSDGVCSCSSSCGFWRSCCRDYHAICLKHAGSTASFMGIRTASVDGSMVSLTGPTSTSTVSAGAAGDTRRAVNARRYDPNRPERTNLNGWPVEDDDDDDGDHGADGSFREWWVDAAVKQESLPVVTDTASDDELLANIAQEPMKSAFSEYTHSPNSFPILMLVKDRYDTLQQTLDSLVNVDGFEKSNLIISQEADSNSFVTSVIDSFGIPSANWLTHPTPDDCEEGAEYIANHYKWAIDQAFLLVPKSKFLVIIEDDMTFSRDFLSYFSHVAPVIEDDGTLWAASAWNDNGFKGHVESPHHLLRTDWFVGFGWLLQRSLFYDELIDSWPQTHWDHWMRDPNTNKGRQTIFPEMPRNFHVGIYGTHSDYDLYEKYFARIEMYSGEPVTFDAIAEVKDDRYEARVQAYLRHAVPVNSIPHLQELVANSVTNPLVVYYQVMEHFDEDNHGMQAFDLLANLLEIWDSSGGMTPRGSRKGLSMIRYQGCLVMLVASNSGYMDMRPTNADVLTPDKLQGYVPTDVKFDGEGTVVTDSPPFQLTGGIAMLGQNCVQACLKLKHKGKTFECDARGFPWLNNCHQLRRAFECTECTQSEGPDQPALDLENPSDRTSKKGVCLWTSRMDSTCQARYSSTRRLCPCKSTT